MTTMDALKEEELARLVRAMRLAQKQYFAMKDPAVFGECKKYEAQVDHWIAKYFSDQRRLFE